MKTIPVIKRLSGFLKWKKVERVGDPEQVKQLWEDNYLVRKIKGKHGHIPEESIRDAVKACHFLTHSPQTGENLMQQVLSKLQAAKR